MNDVVLYPLYKRVNGVRVQVGATLVDDWAVEYLDKVVGTTRSWSMFHGKRDAEDKFYARTNTHKTVDGVRTSITVMMHTFLLRLVDPEGEFQADGLVRHAEHKDRNPLNNTLENLRWATPSENVANQDKVASRSKCSKYKGVFPNSKAGAGPHPWRAKIGSHHRGTHLDLGCFKTEDAAARAYNAAALKKYGEFAVLNVIQDEVTR